MKRNRGFSLVELMVVIAILGIVTVGGFTLFLSVSSYRAKMAVKDVDLALSNTRMHAISKSDAWIRFDYVNDHYVLKTSYNPDMVLKGDFTMTYVTSAGDTYDPKTKPFVLTYDRSSGAFKDIKSSAGGGGSYTSMYGGTTPVYCTQIKIEKGSHTFIITLYPQTGKHVCEE